MQFPYQLIDLSHTIDENIPCWDSTCGFRKNLTLDYTDCSGPIKFRVQEFTMNAGIGTHLDAPAHCIPNGITIEQLPLSQLIAPCVVIDISKHAHESYKVTPNDLQEFENNYGKIKPGTFVIIKTGWERFWHIPDKYRNNYQFPAVASNSAQILIERDICGLGIDTLSPDHPIDDYPVHNLLLGKNKYIIENLANLDKLPPINSFILALPLKIAGATEAPMRVVALIDL